MNEKKRQTTPTFPDVTPEQRRLLDAHESLHARFVSLPKRTGRVVNAPRARPPQPLPKRYFVHWGWMHKHVEEFTDFDRALVFYVDHKGGPSEARLLGEGADADCDGDGPREVSDGLTDEERKKLEMYG